MKMGRKKNPEPWEFQNVGVGEELKLTVALTLKKLTMTETQKELEFPSALTAPERKYIHMISQQLGFKSKSRGKGSLRFLTVYKKEGSTIMSREAILELGEMSRSAILGLLQRCPVTNKERQDLLPGTEKDRLMNPELRDLNLVRSLGRLSPGPPQVPPMPSQTEFTAEARKLPVWEMKEQLLSAINHNQIILVSGETGSGKTSQVPQLILQDATTLSKPCRIFCTQPRRISALSIAERVAAERGEKVGYTVGYQIRLEGKLSPKTLLTFCTTGVLLRTLMGGESALSSVTHVIVDEVHERDRFTDFLLTVLRDCLPKFRHLKLILMSANLDANLYAKYFNNCPVIDVPGKTYTVKPYFLEDILKSINYMTPRMRESMAQLQKKEKGLNSATEWATNVMKNLQISSENNHAEGSSSDKINGESSDGSSSSGNNESHVRKDMDDCIEKAFRTGEEDYFSQMIYLIMSENVSPDYQHSTTWASPLMVAAGRGRIDIMEQLLAIGASIDLKAANQWTATDWAESTNQQEVVDFLRSYGACEGIDLRLSSSKGVPMSSEIAQEDKALLEAYSLSLTCKGADTDLIYALCLHIHQSQPPGGILIFLPGYEDIVTLRERITNEDQAFGPAGKYNLFCLHSSMQSTDQKRVFRSSPTGVRKIVLATNIAETSLTINDIVYVIDCGKVKEISYDALSGISCLQAVWVSQASANQRKGRAGRCQPGICYHLFSKSSFDFLQPFQTPEILRTPLQDLCLHTKLLAMPNVLIADFLARAPEPPAFIAVKNAVQLLKSMDALDPWEDVTELGHHLLDLPLPPHLGKMVIVSTILKCLDPVLTIAATLAFRDPFVLPSHWADKSNLKIVRKKFSSGSFSDHMVLLKAFQSWQKSCSEQWQKRWCERNFISSATMEMVHGMRAQVLAQLRSSGFVRARGPGDIRDVNVNSDNWAIVKAAILSGVYPNLIRVDRDQNLLRTERESKVRLHSSSVMLDLKSDSKESKNLNQVHKSVVSSLPSDWLIYDEMIRIGLVAHVKTVTLVSPFSVLLMAGPMRLPLDALSEPTNRHGLVRGPGDLSSDSESEERPEGMNCFVKIDPWVQFLSDHPTSSLALQLRHKMHSLILRRLRAPNKPLTPGDEDIVRVLSAVLSQEEQNLGLQQPPGVGQRPRPFYTNTHGQETSGITILSPDEGALPSPPHSTNLSNGPKQPFSINMKPAHPISTSPKLTTCTNNSAGTTKKELVINKTKPKGPNGAVCTVATSAIVSVKEPGNRSSTPSLKSSSTATGSANQPKPSDVTNGKNRYFIVRVNSYKQIELSQNRGLWAFSIATEKKLTQAAQNCLVYLIFALNRGNQFHGFAKFRGQKSEEKCPELSNFGPQSNPLYKVEWVKKWYIYFHQTRHLVNPFTDNLQVHMCRDGQEVEPSVGEQLIKVWDSKAASSHQNNNSGAPFAMMNDLPVLPHPRHMFHPHHGPPPPHMGPPMHGPPFPRGPFRNFGAPGGWFGGGSFRGGFRGGGGGYRR